MLDEIAREDFVRCLNQIFRLHADSGEAVEAELIEVKPLGSDDGHSRGTGKREPFALILRAPRDAPLGQQIFRVENDSLGALQIFLVPIGPDEHGMRLEAIFN